MNLFRSEEHVKNWASYDPVSAESVIPVDVYAQAFSGPLFKNRLTPDYLSRTQDYAGEFVKTLQAMGKGGPFWIPT
ncbi:hypothetical protein [Desulfopila inferna]|uniref:hypothetical protein n=1 Tax=Desulfopila inferna TaxID=468528 RepID=UPI001965EBA4|nr:hypothetical protein [Desulfopila inferna]MBM9603659.1 hypothetical protein [Desulfopila inferna]